MSGLAIIPTVTELAITNGEEISITSRYQEDSLPNTLAADISIIVGSQDTTNFIEGELIIRMKNYPSQINYTLDSNGNLIVVSSTGDASNYSINGNGELIWTP
jgi:hypothetical protein